MRFPLLVTILVSLTGRCGGSYSNRAEIEKKVREVISKSGGDPSFLRHLLDEKGIPKSLRSTNVSISELEAELNATDSKLGFCLNITEEVIAAERYSNCPILISTSKTRTIVKMKRWDGFKLYRFILDLVKLDNIELNMEHNAVLVYFYFSSFRMCVKCRFNLSKSKAIVGLRFAFLNKPENLKGVEVQYRPRLKVRGNSQLRLSNDKKQADLKRICNPEECDIQEDYECFFRESIRQSAQYRDCRHVYGDMHFTSRFNESQPDDTDFLLDGCFHFNRTNIRFVRPMLKTRGNCSRRHTFTRNDYMCTDQIEELRERWGRDSVDVDMGGKPDIHCYQGECAGGFVHQRDEDRFVGCELVRGDLYVREASQNVTDRIRDLSNVHEIYGQLQFVDNPSVVTLGMPFLKLVRSETCPALMISNMRNLKNIVFHPHVVFECHGDGPIVSITGSPKIHLHAQMLKKLTGVERFDISGFEFEPVPFYDDVTAGLVITGLVIIVLVELLTALWRNLLLPTSVYHFFPAIVKRRTRQKPVINKRKFE